MSNDRIMSADGTIAEVLGDPTPPERCPVEGCANPEPPPEKWMSCFYDGSPCQRVARAALKEDTR